MADRSNEQESVYRYGSMSPDLYESSIQSKKGGKDQESIQSSTKPDPGYHMGKWQKHN